MTQRSARSAQRFLALDSQPLSFFSLLSSCRRFRLLRRLSVWLTLGWIVWLCGFGAMGEAAAFVPSPAYKKLSPYRAGPTGSLRYIARHFRAIYGVSSRALGGVEPIQPRLGFPSFVVRGGVLHLSYLGRWGALRRLKQGASFWLVPRGASDCSRGRCYRLGPVVGRKQRAMHKSIAYGVLAVRVPAHVPPGFYDLMHRIPRTPLRFRRVRPRPRPPNPAAPMPLGFMELRHLTAAATSRPVHRSAPTSRPAALPRKPNPKESMYVKRVGRAVKVLAKAPDKVRDFTFVHLTDFHLRQNIQARLRRVVNFLNKLTPRPAFVLLTGDIVEYGNRPALWRRCVMELMRLNIPVFAMIGNHDYYRVHWGQPAPRPGLLREEEGLHEFAKAFHPFLAYRFRFGGYHWLSVDTGSSATSRTWYNLKWVTLQGLGRAQLKDIKRFLKTPARYGHVLFAHGSSRAHVRHDTNGCDMGRHGVFLMLRAALEKALVASYRKRPRPLIYLHGHTHWNDMYGRPVHGERCRLLRIKQRNPMMGSLPCWSLVPVWRSPLLISTQAATKHQPLRSGGILQVGMHFGQGAGAGYGFRLFRVKGKTWKQALYRFYYRTRVLARQHPEGYIAPGSQRHTKLPACRR